MTRSLPPLPAIVSVPFGAAPSSNVSLPRPPVSVSPPSSPASVSSPWPPVIVSSPSPPESTLLPVPPVMVSSRWPPVSVSPPLSPVTVRSRSVAAPVTASPPPESTSAPSLPVIVPSSTLVSVTSTSSSPFRFAPPVPSVTVSAPLLPVTVNRSRTPVERSTTNSISDRPDPSTATPGANWPPLRSTVTFSAPVVPLTTIVSVSAVVAAPQAATPTMIRPALAPVPTAMEAESPAALMLTVAVPAPNTQLTAPCAGAAAPSAIRTAEMLTIVRSCRDIDAGPEIRQLRANPLAGTWRAAHQLAPAVGADRSHRVRARRTERALEAADPRLAFGGERRAAALALLAHLQGHRYRASACTP